MKLSLVFYNPLGFFVLLKREITRFTRIYIQTLLAPLFSNILFLGIFGGMFKTRQVGIDGVGYLKFLVPGLVAMGAIFAAFQNPSSSLITRKYQGTIQEINSYPLSSLEKLLAFVMAGTIRGLLIGVLTYAATIYFVGFSIDNPLLFLFMIITASFIFSSLGFIAGLFFTSFDKFNFLFTLIITPMTYLGGVFYEVSRLPAPISRLAYFNPLFYLINSIRYGYLGISEGNILFHFGLIFIMCITSFSAAYIVLKKGVGLTN